MNLAQIIRKYCIAVCLCILQVLMSVLAAGQSAAPGPLNKAGSTTGIVSTSRVERIYGESVLTLPVINQSTIEMLGVTNRDIYTLVNPDSSTQNQWRYRMHQRPMLRESRIVCGTSALGETGDTSTKYVAWDSGDIERIEIVRSGNVSALFVAPIPLGPSEKPLLISAAAKSSSFPQGAIAVLTTEHLYGSGDGGGSWNTVDDAGLSAGTKYSFSLHYPGTYILAHSKGLWLRGVSAPSWSAVPNFADRPIGNVFVDRLNRIFVPDGLKLWTSTTNAVTWNAIDSNKSWIANLESFGDDNKNNLYATDGFGAWKFPYGMNPGIRIDNRLNDQFMDDHPQYPVINSIGGDTHVFVGTTSGAFKLNADTSWQHLTEGLKSRYINGMVELPSGKQLVSNNVGFLTRPSKLDSIFNRAWPTKILPDLPLFADKIGNVYTTALRLDPLDLNSLRINMKSTDGGMSFTPDTAQLSSVGSGDHQYYAVTGDGIQWYSGHGFQSFLYSKSPAGVWTPDVDGIGSLPTYMPTALGDAGNRYYFGGYNLSTGFSLVWSRGNTESAWTTDTAGLGAKYVYAFSSLRNGLAVAGTFKYGIWRHSNSTFKRNPQDGSAVRAQVAGSWIPLESPAGVDNPTAYAVSVDSGGAIFAAFYSYTGSALVSRGVYYSVDSGTTWIAAGFDSVNVRSLGSYGTTTYVCTFDHGLFVIEREGPTFAAMPAGEPMEFSLEQNYPNPFNPSTRIRYSLPRRSEVSLSVFNVLGQKIADLATGNVEAGIHEVEFDGSQLASGVYFCRMIAGTFVRSRKLLLLK